MASPESQRIRATFTNNQEPSTAALEQQRQEWEAAVVAANLQQALVTSANLDGLYGEWVS